MPTNKFGRGYDRCPTQLGEGYRYVYSYVCTLKEGGMGCGDREWFWLWDGGLFE